MKHEFSMLPYQKFFYTRKVLFLIYIWSIPAAIIRIYYINLVDIISVLLPVLQHRFSATKFDLITIDKSIRDRMNTVNCADPCDLFIYIYTHVCIYIYIHIYIFGMVAETGERGSSYQLSAGNFRAWTDRNEK